MRLRRTTLCLVALALCVNAPAYSQEDDAETAAAAADEAADESAAAPEIEAKTLFELLDLVKNGLEVEREENLRRSRKW